MKYRMYICIGLVIWCTITSITYFIEGKTGSGCIWLFNTGLWIFNTYINRQHLKIIESMNEQKNIKQKEE